MFLRGLNRGGANLAQAFKRSNKQIATRNMRRQVNTHPSNNPNIPYVGQDTKGWSFISPNIAQYSAQEGSLLSIGLRAAIIWNFAMLIYESAFYPYDVFDLLMFNKVE